MGMGREAFEEEGEVSRQRHYIQASCCRRLQALPKRPQAYTKPAKPHSQVHASQRSQHRQIAKPAMTSTPIEVQLRRVMPSRLCVLLDCALSFQAACCACLFQYAPLKLPMFLLRVPTRK